MVRASGGNPKATDPSGQLIFLSLLFAASRESAIQSE